jgi:ABC-type multidrug transport system fused ATPase/permease subunit
MLTTYTKPVRRPLVLLALILAATIAVQLITPILTARFIDRAVGGAGIRDLVTIALLVIGVALVGQLLAPIETWASEHIGWEATNALRADLLEHLLRLDASFHARHTVGELIERVDGDVANLARFFSRFVVNILGSCAMVIGIMMLLFRVDWRVGTAIAIVLILAVVSMLSIRAIATPAWAKERQASADYYGFLGEVLTAREDVRSNNAVAYVSHRATMLLRALYAVTGKAGMLGYALAASTAAFFGLGTVAALTIGATRYQSGAVTLGAVYLVFQYTQMLRQPVNQLRDEIQDLQQADASLGRVATLLAEAPSQQADAGVAIPDGPLGVALDGVTFGYDPADPVVCNISVQVPAGRVLGIVGRTGSGKTTIARLLTRTWTPQTGRICLDTEAGTIPLDDVRLDAIRRRIGLVTQDVSIFGATVSDNLTLFDPSVPDDRLCSVLSDVGLDGWLAQLPDGLDSRLQSGGTGLSAGQAQLIACARLLLRNPDVIVLDEASSRLDPASERQLHRVFARMLEGRTGVMIAHRIDTLSLADDILVLDHGRMVENGPRDVLVADPDSRFSRLLATAEGDLA